MNTIDTAASIGAVLADAHNIVVVQADNPDGDSLGSSLALEQMLEDMDKHVTLYCGVDITTYLRYLDGWDRVTNEMPRTFDACIFIDVSTYTLLEKLRVSGQMRRISAKPTIVLDHHAVTEQKLDFATVTLVDKHSSSCGEVLYNLACILDWPVNEAAAVNLTVAILSDTQGLANDLTKPNTYRVIASLVELGVDRPQLEDKRREFSKFSPEIFYYKAKLIERTEFHSCGRIATIAVPQSELNKYSALYNPAPLVQNDMLNVQGVAVAIVLKYYDDGKVTGAIRCNNGYPIGDKLAVLMNGGGHPFASGFKSAGGRSLKEITSDCIRLASQLLNTLAEENKHAHV